MRRSAPLLLVVAGALLLADAGLTVAWQEPVSGVYARVQQSRLYAEWQQARLDAGLDVEDVGFVQVRPGADPAKRRQLTRRARAFQSSVRPGHAIGELRIASIGVEAVVVGGVTGESLRLGPGHYPSTGLPGGGTTVAFAGHRTTYLAPFRRIDELGRGDEVVLTLPYGRFTYAHEETRVVEPSDVWVTEDVGYERLVLTACHPLFSDARRIVVFARLVRSEAASERR